MLMSRLAPLDPDALSPQGRQVYQAILSGARGSVEGPLRAWLASPEFADRAQSLGLKCRFSSCFPPRLSELAILVVAAHWKSQFEWHAHAAIAHEAGLPPGVIDAVRAGALPPLPEPDQAIVYAFATELLARHAVSQDTFQQARDRFGDEGIVDLIGILGYYTLIAMTIAAFDIEAPGGQSVNFSATAAATRT